MNDEENRETFIEHVHDQQSKLAEELATALLGTLRADAGMDWEKLQVYLPKDRETYEALKGEVDPEARLITAWNDLSHDTQKAVQGVTDLWASLIIRSKSYRARRLVTPSDMQVGVVTEAYDIQSKATVSHVVNALMARTTIPLIGTLKDGILTPDRESLSCWRSFYNWNAKADAEDNAPSEQTSTST